MKEGLGVVGSEFFSGKNIENSDHDTFEPPLNPLLGKEGTFLIIRYYIVDDNRVI